MLFIMQPSSKFISTLKVLNRVTKLQFGEIVSQKIRTRSHIVSFWSFPQLANISHFCFSEQNSNDLVRPADGDASRRSEKGVFFQGVIKMSQSATCDFSRDVPDFESAAILARHMWEGGNLKKNEGRGRHREMSPPSFASKCLKPRLNFRCPFWNLCFWDQSRFQG